MFYARCHTKKYINSLAGFQVKAELDPTVAAINTDMDSLFLRLDALSHFQFRPQPIREEIKIVNNMPSLHMEEVGPTAAVEPDATLLAPEEVMKAAKRGAPKATEERTETDRKRERRQKKRKQQ
jgi:U3 small nucleolar ribonucleoprotein component